MWAFIFGGLILATIIGILYLAGRITKFSVVKKLIEGKGDEREHSKENKIDEAKTGKKAKGRRVRKLLAYVIISALLALIIYGTGKVIGTINAEICIVHLVVIWLICDGVSKLVEKKHGRPFARYYAGMAAIVVTFVYLACGWYLDHHVWATKYTLETEKQVGSLRIIQFADSHVGSTFDGEEFLEHVKAIQAENPDIVVITGDYVDDDTSKEDMVAACATLGTLETTYGVYYVFGNHDKGYYGPAYRGYSGADLVAELEKNNVTVLQDDIVLLGDSFYLIGRQDRSEEHRGSRASMAELTAGLDSDKYSIVLDHQPSDYDAQAASGVDLVLSGHTHGGQFFPINYIGQWTGIDDKRYGLEKRENTNFIVTSGISDWAIQFKTGCKSEYVVIDIHGAP